MSEMDFVLELVDQEIKDQTDHKLEKEFDKLQIHEEKIDVHLSKDAKIVKPVPIRKEDKDPYRDLYIVCISKNTTIPKSLKIIRGVVLENYSIIITPDITKIHKSLVWYVEYVNQTYLCWIEAEKINQILIDFYKNYVMFNNGRHYVILDYKPIGTLDQIKPLGNNNYEYKGEVISLDFKLYYTTI